MSISANNAVVCAFTLIVEHSEALHRMLGLVQGALISSSRVNSRDSSRSSSRNTINRRRSRINDGHLVARNSVSYSSFCQCAPNAHNRVHTVTCQSQNERPGISTRGTAIQCDNVQQASRHSQCHGDGKRKNAAAGYSHWQRVVQIVRNNHDLHPVR